MNLPPTDPAGKLRIAQDSRIKFASAASVESVTSISATEQYDREEPLITKTQKFFKKSKLLPAAYLELSGYNNYN